MGGATVKVRLVDGTYELFRHHFGRPESSTSRPEIAATRGVLWTVIGTLERDTVHVGVATDHVIESFRNELWPGYKRGDGIPPELLAQFPLIEEALAALGVTVWPMVELEADDALASAAAVASEDPTVSVVEIATPDKDLAQCVVGDRVVQLDSKSGRVTNEAAVRERYGIGPASIPDWLALVGDSADGFPGLPGWGKTSASAVLGHYGHLEHIPDDVSAWDKSLVARLRSSARLAEVLAAGREVADLFRVLATLRVDRSLLGSAADLAWRGPTPAWPAMCQWLGEPGLVARVDRLAARR